MEKRFTLDILRSGFIDDIPLIIIGLDESGRVLYWNKHAEEVTGLALEEAVSRGFQAIVPVFSPPESAIVDDSASLQFLKSIFLGKNSIESRETVILSRDGQVHYIKWSAYIADSCGKKGTRALILSGVDQTELYALKEVITEKARYVKEATKRLKKYTKLDPLTGLFNYRHLISELNRNFYQAVERDGALSLAIMNLDYFYSINSAYGTANGNRVLRELGALIRNSVDESFIVSRFSGGEIAILMPNTDIRTGFKWSRRVFLEVAEHNFASKAESIKVNISTRMAIGGYPHCEDAKTPEQLIGRVLDKLAEARTTASSSVLICEPNAVLSEEVLPDTMMRGDYPYTVEFVNALARAVKSKDNYTQEHSSIMSEYAVMIADCMGMNRSAVRDVRLGSILHDVGKIGIDKSILLKPDTLTIEEREIIKQHPRIGAEIIRNVHPLKGVVPIVLHHHERYDGRGYLDGLKGEEIPMGARIVSLADVFQALTSNRPYRKALSQEHALAIIKEYSGSFFDPKVVKAFFEVYSTQK